MWFRAKAAGTAALRAAGKATVFAAFERSCYVETPQGIACVGERIGLGPLNIVVERYEARPVGSEVTVDLSGAKLWKPGIGQNAGAVPDREIPESIRNPGKAFLDWLGGKGRPDDALIGLGPGLTPAGDDFVGGAMIALRMRGDTETAEKIAGWALPLARERTNRISRAHLECAAQGEGHEALHDYLKSYAKKHLQRLARIGHTSGLDAAAGALLALRVRTTSAR